MNRIYIILLIFIFMLSCSSDENNLPEQPIGDFEEEIAFISAVDISRYPEIELTNSIFYNSNGIQEDFLTILKENGINTIRLRLWVNPTQEHSGYTEVQQFSQRLKAEGFNILLALHYSDTWADPGNQERPLEWQNLNFNELKSRLYNYTTNVVNGIQPDYIQIGNEINSGLLHPMGDINNSSQFIELLQEGVRAVRDHSEQTKIILHYAGIDGAEWFYNQVNSIDYDIIGLSFYPIWHGKSLIELSTTLSTLTSRYNKDLMIVETAYPFTLEWNDFTNNIVGLEEQLILPDFPATPQGQQLFVSELISILQETDGIGLCYWGAELIAWQGNTSATASPWENQALFDFENHALPVFQEFTIE